MKRKTTMILVALFACWGGTNGVLRDAEAQSRFQFLFRNPPPAAAPKTETALKAGDEKDLGPMDKYVISWIPSTVNPSTAMIKIEDDTGKTQDFDVPANVKFTVVKGAVGYSNGKLIIIEPDSA